MCDHYLLQNKLTKGDNKPLDLDLTFICQYSAKQGIKVCKHYENSYVVSYCKIWVHYLT